MTYSKVLTNILIQKYYFIIFPTSSKPIAHNVPAVCDVFVARIRALWSKDQGCKNVGAVSRGSVAT
jgi:hypothetical protein